MYFLLKNLCDKIGCEKKIYIYGAGKYATEIYNKLCIIGWKDRIKNFVVTFIGTQLPYIDDIPVIEFDSQTFAGTDNIILVAVSEAYVEEIRDKLRTISPEKVLYLLDFIGSTDNRLERLLSSSFDEFCNAALDEYIWRNPQNFNNKENLKNNLQQLLQKYKNKNVQDKSITYIIEEETARDIKIIRALLEKGYNIKVLQYAVKAKYVAEKELLNMNILTERFECAWEFMIKSLKHKPCLYFFDTEASFECASVAIRYRDIWGKVVVAPYETFIGCFINISENVINEEKFCLENADAVVWRYFSKEYLERKMGYRFKGESIHLLDNCGGYELPSRIKECSSDGRLKLCCVVAQIGCFLCEDSSVYTRQAKFIDILDSMDESCELNVFAWSASADEERQLADLQRKYKNFKYFLKVEHRDLICRISTCDYGLCVWTNEQIPDYPIGAEVLLGGIWTCTEGSYRYSVANRYFDYIDAELPIITTLPEKLCDYLQQYDVIVRMNSSNLDVEYLKKNKDYYKKKAKAAKTELLMSKHINILTDLFESVCAEKNMF